ncbi:MAG: hypothetical protein M2R45_03264 [Verrucomicrobia subdivision 3 bacterium]|nr:hypothetical protein [Limisphaerales bacterium]MCS1416125.1 hypothetical protein [Limisphaerales bacterium]
MRSRGAGSTSAADGFCIERDFRGAGSKSGISEIDAAGGQLYDILVCNALGNYRGSHGYLRVAQAFNINGSGVRRGLAAVARAILLDQEVLEPALLSNVTCGKQRELLLSFSHLIRAFYKFRTESPPTLGRFGIGLWLDMPFGQALLYVPNVFNFFGELCSKICKPCLMLDFVEDIITRSQSERQP